MKRLITLSLVALIVMTSAGCKPRIRVKPKVKSWTKTRVVKRPVNRTRFVRPAITRGVTRGVTRDQQREEQRRSGARARTRTRTAPERRRDW